MLSYGSAFWPVFWAVILGGAALTIMAVAAYSAGSLRREFRRRPHPALTTIPVPRRPADTMTASGR
ncbi:MAG TPA: hypothetical protein VKU39_03645 [Streptosporangiaceae bacterium]|nr:hypothetical protein [Streptosporangiaceae bacterium]